MKSSTSVLHYGRDMSFYALLNRSSIRYSLEPRYNQTHVDVDSSLYCANQDKNEARFHDAVIKRHFTLARHDQLRRYALRRNFQLIGSCFTQEKVQNWVTMNFIMGAQIALQIYDILNSRREATKSHSKVWDHHKKLSRKQQKQNQFILVRCCGLFRSYGFERAFYVFGARHCRSSIDPSKWEWKHCRGKSEHINLLEMKAVLVLHCIQWRLILFFNENIGFLVSGIL